MGSESPSGRSGWRYLIGLPYTRNERNRMAAEAGRHVAPQAANGAGRVGATDRVASLAADPLSRLEAELGAAGANLPEGERLHAETWTLLEEAWSLVTECLVIRDSLLEACQEVERTMSGIQDRLGVMAAASEPTVSENLGNGDLGNGDLGNGDLGNGDLRNGDLGNGDLRNGRLGNGDLGNGHLGNNGRRVAPGRVIDDAAR
jgi:hypothetical protein